MTRFPMTLTEFLSCTIGTALTIYIVGSIMGVPWFG